MKLKELYNLLFKSRKGILEGNKTHYKCVSELKIMYHKPQNKDFDQLVTIHPYTIPFNALLYDMRMYSNLFPKIVIG